MENFTHSKYSQYFSDAFIIAFWGNYLFYKQSFAHKRQKVLGET